MEFRITSTAEIPIFWMDEEKEIFHKEKSGDLIIKISSECLGKRPIYYGGNVELSFKELPSIESEGNIILKHTECQGTINSLKDVLLISSSASKVFAFQNVDIRDAKIDETIVSLERAYIDTIGEIEAIEAKDAYINNAPFIQKISATKLFLWHSKAVNVQVREACTISYSVIEGEISGHFREIEIKASKVNRLVIHKAYLIPKRPKILEKNGFYPERAKYLVRLFDSYVEEIFFEDPGNCRIELIGNATFAKVRMLINGEPSLIKKEEMKIWGLEIIR